MTTENNGSQSEEGARNRAYVVLEEGALLDAVRALLTKADVGLSAEEWDQLNQVEGGDVAIYKRVAEHVDSRNSAHALMQVGSRYDRGETPPLVAVSERMFKPRRVSVTFDPRVNLL